MSNVFPLVDDEFLENFSSPHTRKSYQRDIVHFFEFLSTVCREEFAEGSVYTQIERKHIIKFRNWLGEIGGHRGEPCAPKTIARKLSSLSSYFDYLVEKGRSNFNPVTSVKRPRREVMNPTNALTRDQVQELMNSIDRQKNSGILHYALLVTFFTTGLRKSEVLNLRRKHYKKLSDQMVLEYRGKGGKLGRKRLHPLCIEAIESYLSWMCSVERTHCDEDWLFQPTRNPHRPGELNRPLNPKTINEILDRYAKKIGLGIKISPHSARATFISELLDQGVDIYRIAKEVNHSSVKTTQEYDKRKREMESDILEKLYSAS